MSGPELPTADCTCTSLNCFGRHSTIVGAIGATTLRDSPPSNVECAAAVAAGPLLPTARQSPGRRTACERAKLPVLGRCVGESGAAMRTRSCNGHNNNGGRFALTDPLLWQDQPLSLSMFRPVDEALTTAAQERQVGEVDIATTPATCWSSIGGLAHDEGGSAPITQWPTTDFRFVSCCLMQAWWCGYPLVEVAMTRSRSR